MEHIENGIRIIHVVLLLTLLTAACTSPTPTMPEQEPSPSAAPSSTPEPSPSPRPSNTPEPSPSPQPSSTPEPSPSPQPSNTPEPSPSPEPSSTPVEDTKTDDGFPLVGTWKTDIHAPDDSWGFDYPIYIRFTETKQYVYHGTDTFNSGQTTDEADLVYIEGSTFIKQVTYIPDHPEWKDKFQKWTWTIEDGTVFFTLYQGVDSEEEALADNDVYAIATGTRVE